ncbi:helix-turn-helix transcriptional regulator [Frankia sp. AvcI1]|uniref:helix-turn-helix transcriptional regulator n=1 Tax=Frankia sp. AvcI1 TaxID=573496 RepID=UPI002118845F|nr:helix-turn-helix transcriptional regulator [Frankia sp. AvcI1]
MQRTVEGQRSAGRPGRPRMSTQPGPYAEANNSETLSTRRAALGYSQAGVAELLGVTQQHYGHLEAGTRRLTEEHRTALISHGLLDRQRSTGL